MNFLVIIQSTVQQPTTTTTLRPLRRTTCISQHPQLKTGGAWWRQLRILLEKSFTACMTLLTETSTTGLWRRLYKFKTINCHKTMWCIWLLHKKTDAKIITRNLLCKLRIVENTLPSHIRLIILLTTSLYTHNHWWSRLVFTWISLLPIKRLQQVW